MSTSSSPQSSAKRNLFGDNCDLRPRNSKPNSRAGSLPYSADGDRPRRNQGGRFGSGEPLDRLNGRHYFTLRDVDLPGAGPPASGVDSGMPSTAQYVPDVELAQPPPPIVSPEVHSSPTLHIDDEIHKKYDQSGAPSSQHQAPNYMDSFLELDSTQKSPAPIAFSGGNEALNGSAQVGVPLLTKAPNQDRDQNQGEDVERPKLSVTREAYQLVRHHTQYAGALHATFNGLPRNIELIPEPPSDCTKAHQSADYVKKPEKLRGGVLGSLLTLYSPAQQEQSHHNSEHKHSSSTGSTFSSGRSTPSSYSKSPSTSPASLWGALATAGSALASPATGVSARRGRWKLKHRPHSGGLVDKLRAISRPNLNEEIRVSVKEKS
jgi:hypothetical protein